MPGTQSRYHRYYLIVVLNVDKLDYARLGPAFTNFTSFPLVWYTSTRPASSEMAWSSICLRSSMRLTICRTLRMVELPSKSKVAPKFSNQIMAVVRNGTMTGRILVSDRAHLVLDYHQWEDGVREKVISPDKRRHACMNFSVFDSQRQHPLALPRACPRTLAVRYTAPIDPKRAIDRGLEPSTTRRAGGRRRRSRADAAPPREFGFELFLLFTCHCPAPLATARCAGRSVARETRIMVRRCISEWPESFGDSARAAPHATARCAGRSVATRIIDSDNGPNHPSRCSSRRRLGDLKAAARAATRTPDNGDSDTGSPRLGYRLTATRRRAHYKRLLNHYVMRSASSRRRLGCAMRARDRWRCVPSAPVAGLLLGPRKRRNHTMVVCVI